MERMVSDGDADGKILRDGRIGIGVAAFIAAPIDQQLVNAAASPDLCAAFTIARQQNVAGEHRRGNAHGYCLLAQRSCKSSEPPSALKADALGIESPREAHAAIHRLHESRIVAKGGERRQRFAIFIEILPMEDFEPGNAPVGGVGCQGLHQ